MKDKESKKLNKISSEAVEAKTGKTWDKWLTLLDKQGAKEMVHKDIASLLYDKGYIKSGWWAQAVTVGYEQARGKRNVNQRPNGYEVSVSKVIDVPISTLYEAWAAFVVSEKMAW